MRYLPGYLECIKIDVLTPDVGTVDKASWVVFSSMRHPLFSGRSRKCTTEASGRKTRHLKAAAGSVGLLPAFPINNLTRAYLGCVGYTW